MYGVAAEYSTALGLTTRYVDVPFAQWCDQELRGRNLSQHLFEHFSTMARLHADNRYDRLTHDVETVTGRPGTTIRDFVTRRKEVFEKQTLPLVDSTIR
jgi:hypothetical protein